MSYDLTLRPRKGILEEDTFVEYFSERGSYVFPEESPDVAAYFSPSTNVDFHFRYIPPDEDEPSGALAFNINYNRAHVFALEAEPELADLVETLDLVVDDPQADGIEGDAYDGEGFLRGWNAGNRVAYQALFSLRAAADEAPYHLPRERVERLWRWNYEVESTEEENGGHFSAPLIGFVQRPGARKLLTIARVEVDVATLLPRVDLVCVTRGEDDASESAFVPFEQIEEALGLSEGEMLSDPWDYWAVTGTAFHELQRFLRGKNEICPVDSVEVGDVHATEDISAYLKR